MMGKGEDLINEIGGRGGICIARANGTEHSIDQDVDPLRVRVRARLVNIIVAVGIVWLRSGMQGGDIVMGIVRVIVIVIVTVIVIIVIIVIPILIAVLSESGVRVAGGGVGGDGA